MDTDRHGFGRTAGLFSPSVFIRVYPWLSFSFANKPDRHGTFEKQYLAANALLRGLVKPLHRAGGRRIHKAIRTPRQIEIRQRQPLALGAEVPQIPERCSATDLSPDGHHRHTVA